MQVDASSVRQFPYRLRICSRARGTGRDSTLVKFTFFFRILVFLHVFPYQFGLGVVLTVFLSSELLFVAVTDSVDCLFTSEQW